MSLFPGAPVYTSLYWREKMPPQWQQWEVHTSFIDRLPWAHRRQQLYLPIYPLAFEQMDFQGYDLVLSNKSGFCHGVITGPETLHICYCLTPTRFCGGTSSMRSRRIFPGRCGPFCPLF